MAKRVTPTPEPEQAPRQKFLKMLEFPRLLFDAIVDDYREQELVTDWELQKSGPPFRVSTVSPKDKDTDFLSDTVFGYRILDDRSVFKVWIGDFPQHTKELLTISTVATLGSNGFERTVRITLDLHTSLELAEFGEKIVALLEYANKIMRSGEYSTFISTSIELEL